MSPGEIDRIRHVYQSYDSDVDRPARYDLRVPGNQAIVAERWRVIDDLLRHAGLASLSGRRVLEVGCGKGDNVAALLDLDPSFMAGVDLSVERIASARRVHGQTGFALADGEALPFPSETFDVVVLFTVLSSILERPVAQAVARDSVRVLRSGGIVVWYDLRVDNPRNRNVRGIGRRRLATFFPGLPASLQSVTLLPPLARRLGRATPWLYPALAALPPLRSHYAAVLRKVGVG